MQGMVPIKPKIQVTSGFMIFMWVDEGGDKGGGRRVRGGINEEK